jgi:hypothetical protein
MNLRSQVIEASLKTVGAFSKAINAIEIGCMFSESEGLSTMVVAQACASVPGSRFVSIEYNSDHIAAAKKLMKRHDADLLRTVEFQKGHSLSVLPDECARMRVVDFALIDGGAHPEVCLAEFEAILPVLSSGGIILVDDLQSIPPSEAYAGRRVFGKATLILPYLVIAEYLAAREQYLTANCEYCDEVEGTPHSHLVAATKSISEIGSWDYRVISHFKHKMMVVGRSETVKKLGDTLLELNCLSSEKITVKGKLRAAWNAFRNPQEFGRIQIQ